MAAAGVELVPRADASDNPVADVDPHRQRERSHQHEQARLPEEAAVPHGPQPAARPGQTKQPLPHRDHQLLPLVLVRLRRAACTPRTPFRPVGAERPAARVLQRGSEVRAGVPAAELFSHKQIRLRADHQSEPREAAAGERRRGRRSLPRRRDPLPRSLGAAVFGEDPGERHADRRVPHQQRLHQVDLPPLGPDEGQAERVRRPQEPQRHELELAGELS